MRQREALQVYLYKLVHGEKHGLLASVLLVVLRAMSFVYGLGVTIKLGMYRLGILESHKLPCKVISLGNITVGGPARRRLPSAWPLLSGTWVTGSLS